MKLKSVNIEDFKRFTDLVVRQIPETTRLIMLVGPNGSGKSSFFDALNTWHHINSGHGITRDFEYYDKGVAQVQSRQYYERVQVNFHDKTEIDERQYRKALYIRTAHRNDPDLQNSQLQRTNDPLEQVRIRRTIDNDPAVNQNYQRLAAQTFDIYDLAPIMSDEFTDSIIGPIRRPIKRLFPNLTLNGLANPLEDGTFRFTKGVSEGFHFKNLSGGEKAAFDLILDLVVAKRTYNDTLFCIDEPEAHMNARLQAELLSVLYDLVPERCQLMLATHSIGMMRRARDIEQENPGSVVFLDFGERDFDEKEVIEPTVTNRAFWNNTYEVALDDLAALVAPDRVVICEGEPGNRMAGRNYSHDARCYERIFSEDFPETQFVPGGNATEVADDKRGIAYALGVLTRGARIIKLVDLDDRSDTEVADLNRHGVRVLSRRNLESYLFDDEVLEALAKSEGKHDKTNELLTEKKRIRHNRTGDPPDDLKLASGEIYLACKKILDLTQAGNDAKTFMRDTLAPLIKPGSTVYEELKNDIFGP